MSKIVVNIFVVLVGYVWWYVFLLYKIFFVFVLIVVVNWLKIFGFFVGGGVICFGFILIFVLVCNVMGVKKNE